MTNKVLLFTGVETYKWTLSDFQKVCDFALAHHIDGLVVKIYEITQGEWNTTANGPTPQQIASLVMSNNLGWFPYGFFYGSDPNTEINAILKYLDMFGIFILDMEGDFDGNNTIDPYVNTLTSWLSNHPLDSLWISTWANPIDHGWVSNILKLDPLVKVWMPQEYSDGLIQMRLSQWPKTTGKVFPTYAMSQETINLIAITDMPSIWEYQGAVSDIAWLDQFVSHVKGAVPVTTTSKNWYDYDIVVPFGNPNFDVGLGGSHDLDVKPPPNAPVTSIVEGVVSGIASPLWGMTVGIQLKTPINGVPYFHYLHLSAVNPALQPGSTVKIGDLIGWVGGGNSEADYLGTTNPTGNNFLNDSFNSSQIQVGIALMRGPNYGGPGWQNFPPIDMSLDPTPTLLAARKGFTDYKRIQWENMWLSAAGTKPDGTVWIARLSGIENVAYQAHKAGLLGLTRPASDEEHNVDWGGNAGLIQLLVNGYYVWWIGGMGYVINSLDKIVFQGHPIVL